MIARERRFDDLYVSMANRLIDEARRSDVEDSGPIPIGDFAESHFEGFRWYRHTRAISSALQRVVDGEIRRLMIACPPQYGKTTLAARILPAYFLSRFPELWVGLSSYGAALANSRGRDARDLFSSAGGSLRQGAATANRWETRAGGGMWTAGIRGTATGEPASLLIVDDPVKNHIEAASPTIQKRNEEWYRSTWLARENRFAPRPCALVHIQTRWDERDLGGYIIEEAKESGEEWHVVHLPHLAEPVPEDLYPEHWSVEEDWRDPGEPLCPELADLDEVIRTRASRGAYFWSALDQGNPMPARGGGHFQAWWFNIAETIEELPGEIVDVVRAWDDGATKDGGDATASVKMARLDDERGSVAILDAAEYHEDGVNVKAIKISTARRDGTSVEVVTPQDPGAAGKTDAAITERQLRAKAGVAVHVHTPSGSKAARARPLSSAAMPVLDPGSDDVVQEGRVWIVRGPWTERLLDVFHRFTGAEGGDDDLVDAASDAYNRLETTSRRSFRLIGRAGRG